MIFPSLFTFGLELDSAPKLVFEVLPIVFSKIYSGPFIAVIFILLLVAAFTTYITLYEPMIIAMQEKLGLTRKKTVSLILLLIFIIGNLPCIMAYGPWRDVKILNRNIFDI